MLGKYPRMFFLGSLVVVLIAVVVVAWGGPLVVRKQVQKNIQLENGSMMFDKWQKLPVPIIFKVYLFNVTNVEAVNKGAKPKLQEIGPYVYKEYREKTVLGYGPNDTIKYMLKKTFIFDQELSGVLTEDDQLTVINFSYLAAILSVNDLMPSLVGMVNEALGEFFSNLTDPFLRVAVKDLLFDGIFLNCNGEHSALGLICSKIKLETPPTMRPVEDGSGYYFSMFAHMNRSESGPYEMVRGTQNMYELGNIVSYKGQKSMKQWGDTYCGMINGSDSSIFPPIDENKVPQRLYNFEPDICRSLYASLVGKTSLFGMPAYYYEISESALAAKTANPENKCFCRKNWSASHDGCLLMGLLNLNPCQGAPAIASLPHFYLGSEELLEYFDGGIKPDKEKHNTYVYIDPVTGVVLSGVRRMQFNIELRQMSAAPQLASVKTGLFPLLWISEGAEIPDNIKQELLSAHKLIGTVALIPWLLLGLSLLCLAVSAVLLARSGAMPCPRNNNSVSFILTPAAHENNKIH